MYRFLIVVILSLWAVPVICAQQLVIDETSLYNRVPANPTQVYDEIEILLTNTDLDPEQRARLLVVQSEIAYYIDKTDRILTYSNQALTTGLLNHEWYVRVLVSQARGFYQKGDLNRFLSLATVALRQAEKFDLQILRIAAMVEQALAYVLLDEAEKASSTLTLANRYLAVLPNVFEKALILDRHSIASQKTNDFKSAEINHKLALEIYLELKSQHFISVSYYNLGRLYQAQKKWPQAIEAMETSLLWAEKEQNELNKAFSLSRLSEFQLQVDNQEKAEQYLKQAIAAADNSNSERLQILVRKNMSKFLCLMAKYQECQAMIEQSIDFADKFEMVADKKELNQLLAEAFYHQGLFEKAYLTLKNSLNY